MGKFRKEEEYTTDEDPYYLGPGNLDYVDFDNPELGDHSSGYNHIKKKKQFGNHVRHALKSHSYVRHGLTLDNILLIVYIVVMVIVLFNIRTVLDFLFYITFPLLESVILIGVGVLIFYILIRYVFRKR